MIEELKNILKSELFRNMLNDPTQWKSLNVDYHPPHVERVWMQFGDKRISLHVIHPCERSKALLHCHPWKSAMYVLPIGGVYEHGVGIFMPIVGHQILSTQEFRGDVYYEMLSSDSSHYVRPIGMPVYSIMLSGKVEFPWNKTEVNKNLEPLTEERKKEILLTFKSYFE